MELQIKTWSFTAFLQKMEKNGSIEKNKKRKPTFRLSCNLLHKYQEQVDKDEELVYQERNMNMLLKEQSLVFNPL